MPALQNAGRKGLYMQAWFDHVNDCLRRQPGYRPDMAFTALDWKGGLVQNTRDKVMALEDRPIFDHAIELARSTHRLILV